MPTCNICKYAGRPIYKSPCSECKGFSKYEYGKIQTNADRIRAMSDEELTVFVRSIIIAEDCPATECDCDKCFFKEPCFNGSKWHGKEIEWLQQPAELKSYNKIIKSC